MKRIFSSPRRKKRDNRQANVNDDTSAPSRRFGGGVGRGGSKKLTSSPKYKEYLIMKNEEHAEEQSKQNQMSSYDNGSLRDGFDFNHPPTITRSILNHYGEGNDSNSYNKKNDNTPPPLQEQAIQHVLPIHINDNLEVSDTKFHNSHNFTDTKPEPSHIDKIGGEEIHSKDNDDTNLKEVILKTAAAQIAQNYIETNESSNKGGITNSRTVQTEQESQTMMTTTTTTTATTISSENEKSLRKNRKLALSYLEKYEKMVRAQEKDDDATIEHLKPVFHLLRMLPTMQQQKKSLSSCNEKEYHYEQNSMVKSNGHNDHVVTSKMNNDGAAILEGLYKDSNDQKNNQEQYHQVHTTSGENDEVDRDENNENVADVRNEQTYFEIITKVPLNSASSKCRYNETPNSPNILHHEETLIGSNDSAPHEYDLDSQDPNASIFSESSLFMKYDKQDTLLTFDAIIHFVQKLSFMNESTSISQESEKSKTISLTSTSGSESYYHILQTDTQLMLILTTVADTIKVNMNSSAKQYNSTIFYHEEVNREQRKDGLTFPEFVHVYKSVIAGMQTLQMVPVEGSSDGNNHESTFEKVGDITRQRTLHMIRAFTANAMMELKLFKDGKDNYNKIPESFEDDIGEPLSPRIIELEDEMQLIISKHKQEVLELHEKLHEAGGAREKLHHSSNSIIYAMIVAIICGFGILHHYFENQSIEKIKLLEINFNGDLNTANEQINALELQVNEMNIIADKTNDLLVEKKEGLSQCADMLNIIEDNYNRDVTELKLDINECEDNFKNKRTAGFNPIEANIEEAQFAIKESQSLQKIILRRQIITAVGTALIASLPSILRFLFHVFVI